MADLQTLNSDVSSNVAPKNENVSMKIQYGMKPTTKRLILDRKTNFQRTQQGGTLVNGDTATFYLSGGNFMDGQSCFLKGRYWVSRSDSTGMEAGCLPRLYGTIAKHIEQIRILSYSGEVIEQIDDFDVITDIITKSCLSTDYLNGQGQHELLTGRQIDTGAKIGLAAAPFTAVLGTVAPATAGQANSTATEATNFQTIANNIAGLLGQGSALVAAGANTIGISASTSALPVVYPPAYETVEASTWITGGVAPTVAGNNLTGTDFIIPLFPYLGFLKQEKYIPLCFLGRLQIDIKFRANLQYVLQCHTAPLNGIQANFNELQLVYDTVRYHDMMQEAVKKVVESDGLRIDFRTYYRVNSTYSTTNFTMQVTKGASDVLSIYTVMRDIAYNQNYTNPKYQYLKGAGGATINWQYQLGTDKFPVDQVYIDSQARAELEKAMGHFGDVARANMGRSDFSTNNYVMAVDLEMGRRILILLGSRNVRTRIPEMRRLVNHP